MIGVFMEFKPRILTAVGGVLYSRNGISTIQLQWLRTVYIQKYIKTRLFPVAVGRDYITPHGTLNNQ